MMSNVCRLFGIFALITGIIGVVLLFFMGRSDTAFTLWGLLMAWAVLIPLSCYCGAEFLLVLLDLEENTRHSKELLQTLVIHQLEQEAQQRPSAEHRP